MTTVTSDPTSVTALSRRDAGARPPAIGSTPLPELHIVPWPDPVIDTQGHDPRSWYVEQFWLPIVGPTSTWLLRRIAARFDREPDGFDLPLDETARGLGLGGHDGRHSPFQRSLARCVAFKLARPQGPGALGVRRRIPPLARRHLDRLPPALQNLHADWWRSQSRTATVTDARNRARRLALTLLDIGTERHAVELQLVRWRVHPAMAHEATQWAVTLPRSN